MDLIKKKKPLAGNLITLAILCALFVLVLILIVTIYCSKVATANDLKMAAEEEKALMAEQAAA